MEDDIIIRYIGKRNERGMELLIDGYGVLITSIVRKHLGMFQSCEDECTDDILLSIWDNIGSFDEEKGSFKNWVGVISKYKAIDYKRRNLKQAVQEDISEQNLQTEDTVEAELLYRELKEEIYSLLKNFDSRDQELFIKHYFGDKPIEYISREMNMKPSVIYNRLSRGRKKLKEKLKVFF
ncbi:MAG: sigma-70 family RNA polymerase sigma factor [Bacillota bacterium]|nr:sigma-70 family RNA polymerase sigma factor [Bacillota bacterium]